jgi:hypothetical protein
MFIQLKSQEHFQFMKTSMAASMQWAGAPTLPAPSPTAALEDQLQLSATTQTAMRYGMQEMNFASGWVKMKFDLDGNVSARVSHSINYSQQAESLNMDFTFTAESLGISDDVFKNLGNQPIQMRFDMSQFMLDYKRETTLTVQQTQRSAGEIITDIAKALKYVFSRKGDESVKLILDKEAFETLIGDARTSQMIDNIVALIGIINHMRLHGGPRNHYEIYVSGKGKPVVNYENKVDVNIKSSQITIQVTILPPAEKSAAIEASSKAADPPVSETSSANLA